ncbi:CHASE2 domain-containing protein [bacterium]|nr:CHASE2 domain-containing protein [bacterium]MBU1957911.1 CHASE2 domain-containing protein [bacterium]
MLKIAQNIGLIVLSLLVHLYFYNSEHIKKFDYDFYDFLTVHSHKLEAQKESFYPVIIDIDEKSLHQLGQWPWPRVIDAQIIDTINRMNPSAIGVNILFPERDRVSPRSIQNFYKNFFNLNLQFSEFPEEMKDNDRLLSASIKKSGATLSTYFSNSPYTASHCQNISYKQNNFSNIKSDFNASSLLCNYEKIQNGVENFGFINAWTDSDGIFRRIPLFMHYKEETFPSFALATLLSFDNYINLNTNDSTILVNFSHKKPKIFSAIDLLNGKVSSDDIQGKIVIIGSSIVGLNPTYLISSGEKISNSMIHAFVIDNILNNSFLTQPDRYKQINLFLSFLLSILIIILLSEKFYVYTFGLIFTASGISIVWLIYAYTHNIYISIGYLWTPFLYFFIVMLAYHAKVINKERQEQEKLLIRQSKLASMGEMITLIAHQWRQPLSVINGIVLNMDMDYRKQDLQPKEIYDKKFDEHLNKIEETTAYLSKTINDFTDFFSKNKKSERFYMEEVITQVQHLSLISNYKNIQIIYRKKENIALIGYKSELIQSLLIIINNAICACEQNLPLTKQGQISINTYLLKTNLFISIEDNGGGIDNKDLKKIFDPYFTTKEKPHGTGLGLYILKLIVEDSLNGKISVSNSKKGATFTIKIPINIEENNPIQTRKLSRKSLP